SCIHSSDACDRIVNQYVSAGLYGDHDAIILRCAGATALRNELQLHSLAAFPMTALALSVLTFFSTALGGLFALRRRNQLYLVMGFSAGVLVAAALLDLLPEALEFAHQLSTWSDKTVFFAAALGFLSYYSLDFFVHFGAAGHEHRHAEHGHDHDHRALTRFGAIAALGLTVH